MTNKINNYNNYNERIAQPKKAKKQNWDGTLVTTTSV